MKYFLILNLIFAFAQEDAAQENAAPKDDGPIVEINMPYTKQNVMVPRDVWKIIHEILETDGHNEEALNTYAIYPVNFTAQIKSKDKGVLKDDKEYVVTFPEGGGELDLFSIVDGKGKFFLRLFPHIDVDSKHHLIYISESPGRLYGEAQWGNGCGNIFDLTEAADKFMGDTGMLATTSKRHYMQLMAGYYIVFQMIKDKLLLAYLRIKDSRYPQFSCTI